MSPVLSHSFVCALGFSLSTSSLVSINFCGAPDGCSVSTITFISKDSPSILLELGGKKDLFRRQGRGRWAGVRVKGGEERS